MQIGIDTVLNSAIWSCCDCALDTVATAILSSYSAH